MSKTLGNGVDPLQVIDEYGADALRFSLVLGISFGNDIRYIPERVEAARRDDASGVHWPYMDKGRSGSNHQSA